MVRVAIIDHVEHTLFIEDIDEDILNNEYNGSEQEYIEDNYNIEEYSWDYITDTEYIPAPPKYGGPIEVNFEDLAD